MKLFSIPNLFTLGNLLCGCLAIVFALEGNLVWSAYLVGVAAVFDFLDGFLARKLNQHSPIGKELDSLADMVTFGVLPGIIVFVLLKTWVDSDKGLGQVWQSNYFPYIAFIIPLFSALRLAKFNVDTRQSESFIGVPTPANTILIASLPLMIHFKKGMEFSYVNENLKIFVHPYALIGLSVIMSFLLISEIPLFALKFKSFGWKGNEIRWSFLGLCVILLATLQFVGIPLTIVLYILMSVISNLSKKKVASP
jgi:CDP-diacylglycerol--serine O-phosphatidyltransferase